MVHDAHKIQRLLLENFTCFERAEFDFSPGVNILIGENGTGKSHILKVLDWMIQPDHDKKGIIENSISEKSDYRTPQNLPLKRDIHREFSITCEDGFNRRDLESKYPGPKSFFKTGFQIYTQQKLFIPPFEMLSWQKGFINLYQRQENGFDYTFYDLAVALDGNLLKGKYLEEAMPLVQDLEKAIGGRVEKRDGRFFLVLEDGEKTVEAPLVAQGINKLAQLIYLVLNGSIDSETILFWDEPETNLNPKYVAVAARFIQTLAAAGVQIFVATHDYLLTHLLSMASEYREMNGKTPEIRFFSLFKTENGTSVESGPTLADLEHNVILDEYARLHDREIELYKNQLAQ